VSLERAVEIAAEAAGSAYPKPTIGCGRRARRRGLGEGGNETGGQDAEVVAIEAAGERARGATLFATMSRVPHWGTDARLGADRIVREGVERVVVGSRDPIREDAGRSGETLEAGVEWEVVDSGRARAEREWGTGVAKGRRRDLQGGVSIDGRVVGRGSDG